MQALVGYTEVDRHALQFHAGRGFKLRVAVERVNIIFYGKPYFRDARVGKEFYNRVDAADVIEAEEKTEVIACHLQQCRLVVLAFAESGARLGVESQEFITLQSAEGTLRLVV